MASETTVTKLPRGRREQHKAPRITTKTPSKVFVVRGGYAADPDSLPEKFRERDLARRTWKSLAEFVFGGEWESASDLMTVTNNHDTKGSVMRTKMMLGLAVIALLLAGTVLAADTYKIDPAHTSLAFSVRHLGINNVKGHFGEFAGTRNAMIICDRRTSSTPASTRS